MQNHPRNRKRNLSKCVCKHATNTPCVSFLFGVGKEKHLLPKSVRTNRKTGIGISVAPYLVIKIWYIHRFGDPISIFGNVVALVTFFSQVPFFCCILFHVKACRDVLLYSMISCKGGMSIAPFSTLAGKKIGLPLKNPHKLLCMPWLKSMVSTVNCMFRGVKNKAQHRINSFTHACWLLSDEKKIAV